jgi:hypothetical protein
MAATHSTLSHRVMPVIEPICHSRSGVDEQYCSISKIMMVVANAAAGNEPWPCRKRKARRVETAGLNQFSRGVSYEVRDW